MELKLNLNYSQVLQLIHQLSIEEKKKLVAALQSELLPKQNNPKGRIQDLILGAPTWSEGQMEDYRQAREFINKSRLL